MAASIFSIPPELLGRVFEFLAEDRHDISSCRLVSKIFKEASSPYLITEVVFAKRLSEIAKLQEVACHPYFSRHVTSLVYDLSFWKFNEVELNDPTEMMEYIAACEEAEELDIRHFRDEEWARRVQAESEFYASLERNQGDPSKREASAFLDTYKPELSENQIDGLNSALENIADAGGDAFRMGCYQSFPRYKRMAHFHESLLDTGDHALVLRRAVEKLPKIRSVTYTDYRGHARRGEYYQELCARLFGNMLEPERWHWQLDGGSCTSEALASLLLLTRTVPRLRSVSFGPHFYEMVSFPQEPLATYKEPHFISLDDMGFSPNWYEMLAGLQTLRLPLAFTEATFDDQLFLRLLDGIPDTMQHLALGAKGPIEGFETLQQANSQVLRPFKHLISGLCFPQLTTLELEGWCIQLSDLQNLLLSHASTLRTLHLINIYFVSNDETPCQNFKQFGAWVAAEMQLTAVEITNVKFCGPLQIPDLPADDDVWLIPGQHDDEEWDGDAAVLAEPNTPMEALFLADRRNYVHRRRPKPAPGHKGDDLGYVPAYW